MELDAKFLCDCWNSGRLRSFRAHFRSTALTMLPLKNHLLIPLLGDQECYFGRGTRNFLVSCCVGRHRISTRHPIPFLSSKSGVPIQPPCSTAFRRDICNDNGPRWSHLHEHCLHYWSYLQFDDCWRCQLASNLGRRPRWRSSVLDMDLSGVRQKGAEERNYRYAWRRSSASLHDPPFPCCIHFTRERCGGTDDHCLCTDCLRTLLHNTTQFQARSFQPRTLESPVDFDCFRLESILGGGPLLASVFSSHGCKFQLLSCHLWSNHYLRNPHVPLHSG